MLIVVQSAKHIKVNVLLLKLTSKLLLSLLQSVNVMAMFTIIWIMYVDVMCWRKSWVTMNPNVSGCPARVHWVVVIVFS